MFILLYALFLIFYYELILFLHTITPFRHMEVSNHMSDPFYPYMIMGIPWIFPYQQSPTLLFIFTSSYVFILFPLSPTPYPYNLDYTTSIVMATYQLYLFNTHFIFLPFFYYYILLCTVHCRSYVHTYNHLLSI